MTRPRGRSRRRPRRCASTVNRMHLALIVLRCYFDLNSRSINCCNVVRSLVSTHNERASTLSKVSCEVALGQVCFQISSELFIYLFFLSLRPERRTPPWILFWGTLSFSERRPLVACWTLRGSSELYVNAFSFECLSMQLFVFFTSIEKKLLISGEKWLWRIRRTNQIYPTCILLSCLCHLYAVSKKQPTFNLYDRRGVAGHIVVGVSLGWHIRLKPSKCKIVSCFEIRSQGKYFVFLAILLAWNKNACNMSMLKKKSEDNWQYLDRF